MILSSLTEKPTSYYVGWRRLASIAGPSCAAPTSRAAPTPWHMSTAGVKRHDLPPICGMALYMTVALPAWKSSFLYSVTHTAAPNSDETGVTKWAVRLLFFSFFCKMTSLIDVPLQYTLQQLPLTRLLHFANRLRLKEKKTLTGLHSLDVVLKLPKKIFLCGLLLLWERRLSQKKKSQNWHISPVMPVIAHINERLQSEHVKYYSDKRKLVDLNTLNVKS